VTTTQKNFISLDNLQGQNLLNSELSSEDETSTAHHFNFFVALRDMLGLAEYYKKVLLNCIH